MTRKLFIFGVPVEVGEPVIPLPVGDGRHDDTFVLQLYSTYGLPIPASGTRGNRFLITEAITFESPIVFTGDKP